MFASVEAWFIIVFKHFFNKTVLNIYIYILQYVIAYSYIKVCNTIDVIFVDYKENLIGKSLSPAGRASTDVAVVTEVSADDDAVSEASPKERGSAWQRLKDLQ